MGAITSILNSEKGLAAFLIIIGATVLASLGHMSIQQWIDFVQVIFGTYVVGKTVQGVASTVVEAKGSSTGGKE